jgi:glycosyltransferase involved in cell wall biosynthesis
MLGIAEEQLMILTVGGDAASKGAQEVMQALALIDREAPDWKYVCKVWPQPRTTSQNIQDLQLATQLGIEKKVMYTTNIVSHNFMPFLMNASDIYAAPSRLEGFGMPQVEANACEKPVVSIRAMALLDTLVHGETALLAGVAQEIMLREVMLNDESESASGRRVVFQTPRTVDYRASVYDIAQYLLELMGNPEKRRAMGEAGRKRVVSKYDYRIIAKMLIELISKHLEIG